MTHPIDDDPMTENRRKAIGCYQSAQGQDTLPQTGWLMSANMWATLDLADAIREQTKALEAIDTGRRLGQ